jgi:DNA-binding NarL/FixJ family response regulator
MTEYNKSYTVGLLDDNPIVIDGIKSHADKYPQLSLLFTANTIGEFIKHINHCQPEVLIVDVILKDSDGLDIFRYLKRNYPDSLVIAFTNVSSINIIDSIYACGAKGYVHKSESPQILLEAILHVLKTKELYVPEELRPYLKKEQNSIILSAREKEIAKHIVDGKSNKEIAQLEFISVNTVDFHRKNLFRKFKVRNVAELVREVIEFGYSNRVY